MNDRKPFPWKQAFQVLRNSAIACLFDRRRKSTWVLFWATLAGWHMSCFAEICIRDGEYEGRPHFIVETGRATYFYDRGGGGFSRLLDGDGKDWISFRKEPLKDFPQAAAAGFRGIPNLVYGSRNPDAGAGHPGFDRCVSDLLDPKTIQTRSHSGRWAWEWCFDESHATLTIRLADQEHPYWFLYEGPIFGHWSPTTHFFGSSSRPPSEEMPDREHQLTFRCHWVYFGDRRASRTLLLLQRDLDDVNDNLWYLGSSARGLDSQDGMVVFGFGRDSGSKPLLHGPGKQFRMGFVDVQPLDRLDLVHETVKGVANEWLSESDWPRLIQRPIPCKIDLSGNTDDRE